MKCSAEVYRGTTRIAGIGAYSRCLREAIVIIDGKCYCGQHHPDKVREREQASAERREAKWRWKRRVREALTGRR